MFTGITSDIGTVRSVEQRGDLRLTIACGFDMGGVELGSSIACSGVCLTVVDKGEDWFAVDISGETRSRTAEGLWTEGSRLNLERSLRVGDELGGHIVAGHVDGVAQVVETRSDGGSAMLALRAPDGLGRYIAPKGSIALDGVSLTVNEVREGDDGTTEFTVNVIPHTAKITTLGDVGDGRQFNVEIDLIARYLERLIAPDTHLEA